MKKPLIVGIGGTPKRQSTTETALRIALDSAQAAGGETRLFGGDYLGRLPLYLTESGDAAREMIDAIRAADGLILASPGYHGTVSGAVKNAIDYVEETARDERPYFDGLPVGLIVTAHGWQATGSTLVTMRSIVHALRGWPTPLGAAINTLGLSFADGACSDEGATKQLRLVGLQATTFAKLRLSDLSALETN